MYEFSIFNENPRFLFIYLFILIMKIQVSTHLVLTKYYQMK